MSFIRVTHEFYPWETSSYKNNDMGLEKQNKIRIRVMNYQVK